MTTASLAELRNAGASAFRRGDLETAKNTYFQALGQTIAREDEYTVVVAEMRDVLLRLGDPRAALTVDWYAGSELSG